MAKFAHRGDSDQAPHSVASYLGLTVCLLLFWGLQTKLCLVYKYGALVLGVSSIC